MDRTYGILVEGKLAIEKGLNKAYYREVLMNLVLDEKLDIKEIPFEIRIIDKTFYIYHFRHAKYGKTKADCQSFIDALEMLSEDIQECEKLGLPESITRLHKEVLKTYLSIGYNNKVLKPYFLQSAIGQKHREAFEKNDILRAKLGIVYNDGLDMPEKGWSLNEYTDEPFWAQEERATALRNSNCQTEENNFGTCERK